MLLLINISTADILECSCVKKKTDHSSTCVTGNNYEVSRTQRGDLSDWFLAYPNCITNLAWDIATAIIVTEKAAYSVS